MSLNSNSQPSSRAVRRISPQPSPPPLLPPRPSLWGLPSPPGSSQPSPPRPSLPPAFAAAVAKDVGVDPSRVTGIGLVVGNRRRSLLLLSGDSAVQFSVTRIRSDTMDEARRRPPGPHHPPDNPPDTPEPPEAPDSESFPPRMLPPFPPISAAQPRCVPDPDDARQPGVVPRPAPHRQAAERAPGPAASAAAFPSRLLSAPGRCFALIR